MFKRGHYKASRIQEMLCITITLADYLKSHGRGTAIALADEIGVDHDYVRQWARRGAVVTVDGSVRSITPKLWHYCGPVESLIAFNYRLMQGR